jgi:hypothetical protein
MVINYSFSSLDGGFLEIFELTVDDWQPAEIRSASLRVFDCRDHSRPPKILRKESLTDTKPKIDNLLGELFLQFQNTIHNQQKCYAMVEGA